MKSLFNATVVQETKERLMLLTPESRRQWGAMTVPQCLAHCTAALQMSMGLINASPAPLAGRLIGRVIKPFLLAGDQPMRRNVTSLPELLSFDPARCDFECERNELLATIDTFADGGAAISSRHPHPLFGQLEPDQWAVLMYKHLDHHLRQFSV